MHKQGALLPHRLELVADIYRSRAADVADYTVIPIEDGDEATTGRIHIGRSQYGGIEVAAVDHRPADAGTGQADNGVNA